MSFNFLSFALNAQSFRVLPTSQSLLLCLNYRHCFQRLSLILRLNLLLASSQPIEEPNYTFTEPCLLHSLFRSALVELLRKQSLTLLNVLSGLVFFQCL